jgi:hypothetical protein
MTPGATATTTDSGTAGIEYDAYVTSTPATTTTAIRRRAPRDVPAAARDVTTLVPLGEALNALVGLEPDWDSYGGLPPTKASLEYAWAVGSLLMERGAPSPQVFPTPIGGVQLEWHLADISLEWEIDTSAASGVFTFDDLKTGERIDGEVPQDIEALATALSRTLTG